MESAGRLSAWIDALQDGKAVLVLSGEIDMATSQLVASQFRALADRGLTDVIIDAREVTFMDSTGLASFTEGKRVLDEKGSRFLLVGSRAVRRILDLAIAEPLVAARFDTMEEALRALNGGT